MKVKFTIVEVIGQDFEMEFEDGADAYAEIEKLYRNGKLVVDNASLIRADVFFDEDEERSTIYM